MKEDVQQKINLDISQDSDSHDVEVPLQDSSKLHRDSEDEFDEDEPVAGEVGGALN